MADKVQYTQAARIGYNKYSKRCVLAGTVPIDREKWTRINMPKGGVKKSENGSGPCFIGSVK